MEIPDLAMYWPHRVQRDAEFEGVVVPGLLARFYRRRDCDRLASVGQYFYGGRELLRAWGFVDEEHCRFSAVRGLDGRWGPAVAGCPVVRIVRDGERVAGFVVQAADGTWVGDQVASDPGDDAVLSGGAIARSR